MVVYGAANTVVSFFFSSFLYRHGHTSYMHEYQHSNIHVNHSPTYVLHTKFYGKVILMDTCDVQFSNISTYEKNCNKNENKFYSGKKKKTGDMTK